MHGEGSGKQEGGAEGLDGEVEGGCIRFFITLTFDNSEEVNIG